MVHTFWRSYFDQLFKAIHFWRYSVSNIQPLFDIKSVLIIYYEARHVNCVIRGKTQQPEGYPEKPEDAIVLEYGENRYCYSLQINMSTKLSGTLFLYFHSFLCLISMCHAPKLETISILTFHLLLGMLANYVVFIILKSKLNSWPITFSVFNPFCRRSIGRILFKNISLVSESNDGLILFFAFIFIIKTFNVYDFQLICLRVSTTNTIYLNVVHC